MSQSKNIGKSNTKINNYDNPSFSDKTNSWRMVRLKDHGSIKVRIGWKNLKQSEYTETGPYLISGKHIMNGKIQWELCDHISLERYEESPEIALKENDIIFSKDGTLGNPAIIKNLENKATINATMMLIRLKSEINPDYFFQILQSKYFHRFLSNYATKSGINHILVNDFLNFTFPLTSIYQQKSITNVLEVFDKKIEFIEKKYNSLISYKKYLLNTLYPDSRANTSYLNSANNNISWNFKPLKDIGTITTGVTPKGTKNEVFDENGLLWITANDLSNDKYIIDTKRRLNASLVKKSKIIKEGSIFVSCIGIIGKIAINKEVCSCNQQINAITPYDEYDSEYIYYTLQRYKNLLNSHASQSVTLLLKKSEFSSIKIPVTDMDNQRRIAEILSAIDTKINLLNRKLDLTKKYKNMLFDKLVI